MAKSALSMLLTTPVPVLQFCSDLSKGFHTRHIAGPDILVSLLPIYEPIKDRSVLIRCWKTVCSSLDSCFFVPEMSKRNPY